MRTAILVGTAVILTTGLAQAQTTDYEALRSTVGAVRDGGVALASWAVAEGRTTGFLNDPDTPGEYDWTACPRIAFAQARNLVGSGQETKLPHHDGWGHEIQYCLRADDPAARIYVVGLRSPGRDGKFDSDVYRAAGFDEAQTDHDIVWIDGIFVTWPMAGR